MAEGNAATGPRVMRRMNVAAVLAQLRDRAPAAARVSTLAAATGLSRPAVTRALADLRERGLVEPAQPAAAQPAVGRPAQALRFRADAGHVAGVEIGPHTVQVFVADLTGRTLAERRETVGPGITGEALHQRVESALLGALAEARIPLSRLWAVTLGTPGIVDRERSRVLLAPSIPGWSETPTVTRLRKRFGCPVHIENDVNLAVLAELWRGAAREADSLVYVQWGQRIGTSIVLNGRPYRGTSSAAGELGFVDVATHPDGEVALHSETETETGSGTGTDTGSGSGSDHAPTARSAGNRAARTGGLGPFEELAGAGALHRLAREAGAPTGPEGDLAPLFAAAEAGDRAALAVVDKAAARFARGLATVLFVLDPGLVVIGGGLSRAGETLIGPVRRHLERQALAPVELRISELGDRAVALGGVRQSLAAVEQRLLVEAGATG
ncbi:ROK family transcriptional regulator [Streptomyces sp. NA04227]|uniref:ROK family transcriptional regulator n=1 Tax=Streptomyces sp. NA04227 TaxID=2742136 RepID=UPI00158FC177|nr:ROK family transcriptional regulator [Streptomyces sp. NA04227]QKW07543.1 ROK family transcriptional regulator [Streptomyces sp. NA04227]